MLFRFIVTGLDDGARRALLKVLGGEPIKVAKDDGTELVLDVPPERFDFVIATVDGFPEAQYRYESGPKDKPPEKPFTS